ncbi:response regulator transcription factor [Mucilaginibacter pedocola]|uniref:DNA-binding response regulator n=1 Tax=Mucilaginibacter pedocola TaxID=1792845 RepID=A0A1S9PF37_9SPHI|nr:response regulator transcription factor [Mucilaginibacter pedocola]OOQ59550.1 DNA-binding response regulator [Mucilaginibacter pedocola]
MELRVTVFDDNNALRESLNYLISGTPGYTLAGAYPNCDHLITDLASAETDVVLMDIDMPGMNGIEATALIKSNFPDVNVLMLTSYDDTGKVFDAIQSGATGYLLKKTPPARILEAITEVYQGGAPMNANIARKVLDFFREKKNVTNNEYDLSAREKEVLSCLVKGDSYKMIADHCFISMGTVCTHITNIYKKLHVNSKSEAVAKAIREKLINNSK